MEDQRPPGGVAQHLQGMSPWLARYGGKRNQPGRGGGVAGAGGGEERLGQSSRGNKARTTNTAGWLKKRAQQLQRLYRHMRAPSLLPTVSYRQTCGFHPTGRSLTLLAAIMATMHPTSTLSHPLPVERVLLTAGRAVHANKLVFASKQPRFDPLYENKTIPR